MLNEIIPAALNEQRLVRIVALIADVSRASAASLIVAGGVVRGRDRAIVGEATVDFIRQFKVDIGIIGVSSIEPDGTLRDFDPREVKVAQAIVEQSREVWLVADQANQSNTKRLTACGCSRCKK
mgnify:CR=1 FL=1